MGDIDRYKMDFSHKSVFVKFLSIIKKKIIIPLQERKKEKKRSDI